MGGLDGMIQRGGAPRRDNLLERPDSAGVNRHELARSGGTTRQRTAGGHGDLTGFGNDHRTLWRSEQRVNGWRGLYCMGHYRIDRWPGRRLDSDRQLRIHRQVRTLEVDQSIGSE